MPDERKCTCIPRPLRDVQTMAYWLALDLQMVADRVEALRNEIELPANAEEIWEGLADPTLAVEVYGCFSVIGDDTLPECSRLFHQAASATVRSVAQEWRRMRNKGRCPTKSA